MVHYSWLLVAGSVGVLIGLLIGIFRMEWFIANRTRRMVVSSHHCYMCEDCPDGCPLTTPDDPRNH